MSDQFGPCPGVPHQCGHAKSVISRALDGIPSMMRLAALRAELGECRACVDALDFEIRFKAVMGQQCREDAPEPLQIRISETLRRVDLSEIDVTDL